MTQKHIPPLLAAIMFTLAIILPEAALYLDSRTKAQSITKAAYESGLENVTVTYKAQKIKNGKKLLNAVEIHCGNIGTLPPDTLFDINSYIIGKSIQTLEISPNIECYICGEDIYTIDSPYIYKNGELYFKK